MKIKKLNKNAVKNANRIPRVTTLSPDELRQVAAGVEPFSCVMFEHDGNGGGTIEYHDGYPR